MPNKFISDKWQVKFEEEGDPLWLIAAVVDPGEESDEYDYRFGVACAPTEEEALSTVPEGDIEDYIFIGVFNLLSLIGRSHMLGDVADLVDTLEDK